MLLTGSCSRHASAGLERLAILPGNVLIDDSASNWMGAASAFVLEYDLSTSKTLVPTVVKDESAAIGAGASLVLRLTLENRAGDAWVQGNLRNISTQRNTRAVAAKATQSQLVTALNQIAKDLDSNAVPFSTSNADALKIFSAAVESRDAQQRSQLLQQATAAAPDFGLAYTLLIEGSPANSPQSAAAIAGAQSHQGSFTPFDRTRIAALLAKSEHQPLPVQVRASEQVLQIAPNDVDALVTLGNARFLQGDAGQGNQFLLKALQLSGNNPNVRRQLVQGLIETRQFAQAEKFVGDLPDAAICSLLQGNSNRANALADKLAASAPSPDLQLLFRATWLAFSGQLQPAARTVQQGTFANPAVRAIALSQGALWELLAGDAAAAQSLAATASGVDPKPGALPVTARLLAQTNLPLPSWRAAVDSSDLSASAKQALVGYGLFLRGNYTDAATFWRGVLDHSGNTDLRARAMLAASLTKAGETSQAKAIRVEPFLPEWTELYEVVSFNEMRAVLK